jgi:hypothetical protein
LFVVGALDVAASGQSADSGRQLQLRLRSSVSFLRKREITVLKMGCKGRSADGEAACGVLNEGSCYEVARLISLHEALASCKIALKLLSKRVKV